VTISQLIAELSTIQEEYGDIPVIINKSENNIDFWHEEVYVEDMRVVVDNESQSLKFLCIGLS